MENQYGKSINNSYVIIDDPQNKSPNERSAVVSISGRNFTALRPGQIPPGMPHNRNLMSVTLSQPQFTQPSSQYGEMPNLNNYPSINIVNLDGDNHAKNIYWSCLIKYP